MFPMQTSLLLYEASAGCVSVDPPSVSEGGGATLELVVAGSWFVGASTDNSLSICLDMSSHVLLWPRSMDIKAVATMEEVKGRDM